MYRRQGDQSGRQHKVAGNKDPFGCNNMLLKRVSFNCYILLAILSLCIVGSQPFRWSTGLTALDDVSIQVPVIVPTLDMLAVAPWGID
jgi:hypothetical protein